MIINRATVYRLDPTVEQAATFAQWAGACRFVYNLALEQRRDYYRPGRSFSYNQQQGELTPLRADVDWLGAVPVHALQMAALQMAVRSLEGAFQRFLYGLVQYPKPRRKGERDSFSLPDPGYLGLRRLNKNRGAVKLPKVGWVKLILHRPLGGELRAVTVSRKAGHWYVSIAWRASIADPVPSNLSPVGIDRGVAVFAALSTGEEIKPVNAFQGIEDKLAKAQRVLARKTKFSANWQKQQAKISRLHTRAASARKNFLHQQSTKIAKSHGAIEIEKLLVRNMTASAKGTVAAPGAKVAQKSGLNRAILDQGWGMFASLLKYKLAERGGTLIEVPAPTRREHVPVAASSTSEAAKIRRRSSASPAATKTMPMLTPPKTYFRPGQWP